jgi:hypothetical protein
MKYVKFILSTLIWISLLVSFISGIFLIVSGIKIAYSELILINESLTNSLICIGIGSLILRFVVLMIKSIVSEND